ncbi:hypothetical protein B0T16DRAFT_423154 [Cercophora newfieldiana]|uniref:Uncharacterized protein n=1 Tax=Cercophora newfieldiana TaxID=92897 RepID=A0AA39XSH8_9PEZI|nr:hypothetical protein B0T16DRAFT_423154 [Cercophora newfieldiana]
MRLSMDCASPSEDDGPLRGNFIDVSRSLRARSPSRARSPARALSPSRARSPSRPSRPSQDARFDLDFNQSPMDKITVGLSQDAVTQAHQEEMRGRRMVAEDADTAKRTPQRPSLRSRSPLKVDDAYVTPRERARSPAKFATYGSGPESRHARFEFRDSTFVDSPSDKRELRSAMKQSTTPVYHTMTATQPYQSSTPRSGAKARPPPIDVEAARLGTKKSVSRKQNRHSWVMHQQAELSPNVRFAEDEEKRQSSHYSQDYKDGRYPSHVSPLRVTKEIAEAKPAATVFQTFGAWNRTPGIPRSESERILTAPSRDDTAGQGSYGATSYSISPLPSLLSNDKPSLRKTSKTMIGHNGWLESTSAPAPAKQITSPVRKAGFFDNIMKKAKGMMGNENADAKTQRKSHNSDKSQVSIRSLAISLNPREQSLLYCELEFALTSALNDYLVSQFNAGRLDADKLKKIAEAWQQKGRPKVVSFRYDLETQLDLVRLHVNDFKFYGRAATSTAILGIIDMMKVDARSLRIRTFCQPDTVVAKQLLDSQNLFNCIGCPEPQQLQLAEITGFFKAAMERERVLAKRDSQRVSEHEAANNLSLRHAKSHSGQSWNKGTGTGPVKRRSSIGAMKMDPSNYDDSIF